MPSRTERKAAARAPQVQPKAVLPTGRELSHTDKRVRDHAVANLRMYLQHGGSLIAHGDDFTVQANAGQKAGESQAQTQAIPPAEMKKLWKGLFYCFWMSDKPLVQQRLAADLADLALQIQGGAVGSTVDPGSTHAALDFIAGFWEAMCREWSGIDRLRMDKFYLLIRRFVKATFDVLQRDGWSAEAVARHHEILTCEAGPLCTTNLKIPPSLAYHLADVWLDELENSAQTGGVVSPSSAPPARGLPVADVLRPFISTLATTSNSVLYARLTEAVMRPLLEAFSAAGRGDGENEGEGEDENENEQPSRKRRRRDGDDNDVEAARKTKRPASLSSSVYPGIASAARVPSAQRVVRDVCSAVLARASAVDGPQVKDANRRRLYALVRQYSEDDDEEEEEEE